MNTLNVNVSLLTRQLEHIIRLNRHPNELLYGLENMLSDIITELVENGSVILEEATDETTD